MTIKVPLTPEEEAKLRAIAGNRGMSPDAFVEEVVKQILERSRFSVTEGSPADTEEQLEELFSAFDSLSLPAGIREEAFHRENWYR